MTARATSIVLLAVVAACGDPMMPTPCKTSADCGGLACVAGVCAMSSADACGEAPAGQPCDDGNACTELDVCNGTGACVSASNACGCASAADCASPIGDPGCFSATCPLGYCLFEPRVGVPCDDGDPCTTEDACTGQGTCSAGRYTCACLNDAQCTTAARDTHCAVPRCDAGTCHYDPVPAGVPCDDASACTTGDACDGQGHCASGTFTCQCMGPAQCTSPPGATACYTPTCVGGGCQYTLITNAPCGGSVCVDSTQYTEQRCDGVGACVPSGAGAACPNGYKCDAAAAACRTSCTGNSDCVSGSICNAPSCVVGIVVAGGGRSWSDGSYAKSCFEYRTPPLGRTYAGATGSAVYTIDPDGAGGAAPFQVWCDMVTDGGGWTLISQSVPSLDVALSLCAAAAVGTLSFDDTSTPAPAKLSDAVINTLWSSRRELLLKVQSDSTAATRVAWDRACVLDFVAGYAWTTADQTSTLGNLETTTVRCLSGSFGDGVIDSAYPVAGYCGFSFHEEGADWYAINTAATGYTSNCNGGGAGRVWLSPPNYGCNAAKLFAR